MNAWEDRELATTRRSTASSAEPSSAVRTFAACLRKCGSEESSAPSIAVAITSARTSARKCSPIGGLRYLDPRRRARSAGSFLSDESPITIGGRGSGSVRTNAHRPTGVVAGRRFARDVERRSPEAAAPTWPGRRGGYAVRNASALNYWNGSVCGVKVTQPGRATRSAWMALATAPASSSPSWASATDATPLQRSVTTSTRTPRTTTSPTSSSSAAIATSGITTRCWSAGGVGPRSCAAGGQ